MTNISRIFNCKDEELVLLSKFTLFSFKRDLADFKAFSPKFNTEFVTNFEAEITKLQNLVEPQTEILARKVLNDAKSVLLIDVDRLAQKLEGYLLLAKSELPVTKSDFGLVALRKALHNGDVEAIVNQLNIVSQNIDKFLSALKAAGLSDEFVVDIKKLSVDLVSNKQQRFEIDSNRKALVQNNLGVLNGVYEIAQEIYTIGKVLYKNNDQAKYKEYTFSQLLKNVRYSLKSQTIETKTI